MMRFGLGLLAVAFGVVLSGGSVRADEEQGRRWYRQGETLVQSERYDEAVGAFEAGFAAAPRAVFQLDIANCHRKLGNLALARRHYWRFLDLAAKDHPARAQVIGYLRGIEQIAADGVPLDESSEAEAMSYRRRLAQRFAEMTPAHRSRRL